MPDLDYTVELTIGSLSWTIHDGDVPDLDAGPVVLAGLRIRWQYPDTPVRPAQPEPMTGRVSIAVKDAAELADLDVGDTVRIDVWVGPVPAPFEGHQHSQAARFMGRVSDMAAAPWTFDDGVLGMLYTFELVDHLADLNEALLGYQAWALESVRGRLSRIQSVVGTYPGLPTFDGLQGSAPFGRYVAARDGDPAPAAELLEEYMKVSSTFQEFFYENSAGTETKYGYDSVRPVVNVLDSKHAPPPGEEDADDAPDGELVYLSRSVTVPHIPGELPGRLVMVAGVGVVSWEPTADSAVPVVPASIVERPSEWVRSKDGALNTITVKTDNDSAVTLTTEANRRHRSAALIETELVDDPGGLGETALEAAAIVAGQYLPRRPRGGSAWSLDELVIRAEQLPQVLKPNTAWSMRYDDGTGTFGPHGERAYGWFPGIWMPERAGISFDGNWCWSGYPVHPVVIHGLPATQHPEGRTTLYGIPDAVELILAPLHGRADLAVSLRQGVPEATMSPPISSDDLAARVDLAGLTYNDLDPLLTCDDLAFVRGT